ncbi:hypothetical protein [Vibrio campbellii]|uniref:hypothetical protein n=1 Tax=Vibrio campbellii TaxID=680 RepID=UPI00210A53B9|nr:hypothetical protein [Vibrio campbellii]
MSAKALLKLNPNYESDPLALKVGDVLTVSAAEQPQEEANSEQTCPQDTFSVGDAYPLGDVWGKYSQRDVWGEYADLTQPSSVINIFSQAGLSPNTPVLNVQKIENRLLRITVSFVEDELQLTHITSIPAGQ